MVHSAGGACIFVCCSNNLGKKGISGAAWCTSTVRSTPKNRTLDSSAKTHEDVL